MLIKTTAKGLASTFFWGAVWLVALVIAATWLDSFVDQALAHAGVSEISEISRYDYEQYYLALGGEWICKVVAGLILFGLATTYFYDARQTNELTESENGESWSKIEGKVYYFPAGRRTKTAVINRVTEVAVTETSWDRIFGTGTLELTLTVFLNATETQMDWTIPGIEDPHAIADAIRAKSLDHDGARVNIERVER